MQIKHLNQLRIHSIKNNSDWLKFNIYLVIISLNFNIYCYKIRLISLIFLINLISYMLLLQTNEIKKALVTPPLLCEFP